jgi:hypothetical protein
LKVERKGEGLNTEGNEGAEGTEKKRERNRKGPEKNQKRTGLKTGHYKEEPYDERREKSGVGSDYLRGG